MSALRLLIGCTVIALAGCASFSHTNVALTRRPQIDPKLLVDRLNPGPAAAVPVAGAPQPAAPVPGASRASLTVDGKRGNEKVLFFLALSGGGSRAAYFSAATMLKLQELFDDVDLLQEVDVVSSVSGGSLPAAYYGLTRDEALRLRGGLTALRSSPALPSEKLRIDSGALKCAAPLDAAESSRLHAYPGIQARDAKRIIELCAQSNFGRLRSWEKASVTERMTRNYLLRWLVNWFWPDNIALYWFTAYDRSDIMAKTLEDNLYDTPILGTPHKFAHLNPYRPYLIINATNATGPGEADSREQFPFGTVFTFTDNDFTARLNSDIEDYSVARAVMGSSAFPFVFSNMTLGDFRPGLCPRDEPGCARYLHVFDGGNSDNLGLKSIKRALFELQLRDELKDYDKVIVLLVDAFTQPPGTASDAPDSRSLISRFVDTNFVQAFDSLLQANRANNIAEFQGRSHGQENERNEPAGKPGGLGRERIELRWKGADCEPATRSLSFELCARLSQELPAGYLDLSSQLVFYHFGFDDVRDPKLKRTLDAIPTSFLIGRENADSIRSAVDQVLNEQNGCLQQIRRILRGDSVRTEEARRTCVNLDVVPPKQQAN